MQNYILLVVFFLCAALLNGQDHPFLKYEFSDEKTNIPTDYVEEEELVLCLDRKIDVISEGERAYQYYLYHEKRLLNSDQAIENNNRIYISSDDIDKFEFNRNRVILPDGNIIELEKNDIHKEEDPETGIKYEYYAVKGLVKGAIIERLYLIKELPDMRGSYVKFQDKVPVLSSNFEITFPNYLKVYSKSYNGLAQAVTIDSFTEHNSKIIVRDTFINALPDDEYMSNSNRHAKMFRYKLFSNSRTGVSNFYNYSDFAKTFSQGIYEEVSKKDRKAIEKYLKGISFSDSNLENIRSIENLVKSTIAYNQNFSNNESIDDLLKSKQSNLFYLIRLYLALFQQNDIDCEVVLTSNRYNKYFDPEFETTNHLDYALLYFKEYNFYLDPSENSNRVPLYNYELGNSHGLKIKKFEFAGNKHYVGELVRIDLPGIEVTSDTMAIKVDFTKDVSNPEVVSSLKFGGYSAMYLQPIESYVDETQLKDIFQDIAKNYCGDVKPDHIETINGGIDELGKSSFELLLRFKAGEFIQRAGSNLLFNVGSLIGRQSELYSDKERVLPIELRYPHRYVRTIEVVLPAGYKLSNPEIVNMSHTLSIDGEEESYFKSSYHVEEDTFVINNTESYRAMEYSVDSYEQFRSVINAAADFNKLVLVLEKIK